ncbi:MAG: IS1380 family transposase [Thermodesulfobacteriota bacterium]
MSQGVLSFKYEGEKSKSGMTALGGLPVYMDMAHVMGLNRSVAEHIGVRRDSQGWTDIQVVTALIMLNLSGGDSVDDLRVLEADEGFCSILRRVELHGLRRKERRELERRWRKEKKRSVPSPSAVFRYLSAFHEPGEEKKRQAGKAFIPAPNEHLRGFCGVNRDFLSFVQANKEQSAATLDMDACLIETSKESAKYCYKGFKAYQPLNTWWAEQGLIVHTEFRDGNVPAGFEQLRVFTEALGVLPEGVEKVRLRSDTAGYQHVLLKYCAGGKNERFGVIDFAIGCDVTPEFKKAVAEIPETDWQPLYRETGGQKIETGTHWAEVCFVPNAIGHSKKGPEYRYIVKRRLLHEQQSLPGMDEAPELPFPTIEIRSKSYKIFGIVTNMDWEGGELINWHHERCGKSEEAHSVMKEDLAGGKLPSDDCGENAAWWWIMILALNLNAAMKALAMGESWTKKRMKAIRFKLINLPARIVDRSNWLWVRLSEGHPSLELLLSMRSKIAALVPAPSG